MTVEVLDSPVRGGHSADRAHAQVEQQIKRAVPAEWMMDMEVEKVVGLPDQEEDTDSVQRRMNRQCVEEERREQDGWSDKGPEHIDAVRRVNDPSAHGRTWPE